MFQTDNLVTCPKQEGVIEVMIQPVKLSPHAVLRYGLRLRLILLVSLVK